MPRSAAASAARTFLVDTNAQTFSLTSQSSVNAAFTTFNTSSVASASQATLALTSLTTFAQSVNTSLSNNASNTRALSLQNNFINAQVDAISRALPGVAVGTVDKFQGQEAAVSIYSMASSSAFILPKTQSGQGSG